MAKKKATSLAANRKKRNARRNPSDPDVVERMNKRHEKERTANPPVMSDLTHVVLPGFGAYAASRVLQRIAFSVIMRRWPRLAKHAHAATGLAAFASAWLLAHRVAKIAKFHDGILVGTGVAALQGVAQAYLPAKYNWLTDDCKADTAALPPPRRRVPLAKAKDIVPSTVGDEFSYLEDPWTDTSPTTQTISPPKAARTPIASAMKYAKANDNDDTSAFDTDLSDVLGADEGVDDLFSGVFEQN